MFIRPATNADISDAAKIYEDARIFMKEQGNPFQWQKNYPNHRDIIDGINNGTGFVCEEGGEIVATFYFEKDADDQTYRKIYNGKWKNDDPYAVIHRIAVKYHGKGIVDFCFKECFKEFPNIKIDTHRDNIPMQKCLLRNGFEYCGVIYLQNGDERIAFQKTK